MQESGSASPAEPNGPISAAASAHRPRPGGLMSRRRALEVLLLVMLTAFVGVFAVTSASADATDTGLTASITAACYPDGQAARVTWFVSGTGNYKYSRNGTMYQSGAAPGGDHSDLPLDATWTCEVTDADSGTVVASATFNGASVCAGTTPTSVRPPCADLQFVGVRGSGETANDGDGFGKTVNAMKNGMKSLAPNLGFEAIDYQAIPVGFSTQYYGQSYIYSVADGTTALRMYLDKFVRDCPTTYMVLAGYS